jgi:hypothetical protein
MTLTKAQFSDLVEDITLNKAQFTQFVENYVSHIVEGLDVESLECMVFDLLVKEYKTHNVGQIIGEIEELYGADMVAELAPVPVA